MDDEDISLILEVTYKDKKFSIEDINLIDLNELIKQSINNFNIENKLSKSIVFSYKDEDGDINIITNKEDIIKSSKEISSNKYLSKLELNIVSDDKNNNNENINDGKNQGIKNLEENEEIKKLEEMNNLKDNKINELEEKIMKLKKECQKLQDISQNSIPSKKGINKEIELGNNNQIINESVKNELKNIISDMFKSERENLENNFKKLKTDLISEMKNNLKKETQNNDELNKIFDDIAFIKENIEINMKENKIEQNNLNENYNQFFFNNMERMKPTKLYKCQNCNCSFMFNECFDINNNKAFDEHNFKLEKSVENQNEKNILVNKNEIINNNNTEEINENETEKNIKEKNEKGKKQYINNEIDKNIKKIEEKKEEKKEIKKEKNKKKEKEKKEEEIEEEGEKEEKENEEEKEEEKEGEKEESKEVKEKNEEEKEKKKEEKEEIEENENEDDAEEVLKFQNVLQKYLYNENGNLKMFYPRQDELDDIKNYYESIYGKIDIENYQEIFLENINNDISKETNKSLLYKVTGRNGRIDKLRYLLNNFLEEKKRRKNFNNNSRRRYHYNKNYRK